MVSSVPLLAAFTWSMAITYVPCTELAVTLAKLQFPGGSSRIVIGAIR